MVIETLIPENPGVYLQLGRFLITLFVGFAITRGVLMPLVARAAERRGSEKKVKHSLENVAGIIGLFLTFTIALQAAEFGSLVTILGAITAALTVAVGFGMRDQVSNLVAGIFIYTDNPFVKGDYIKTGETEGVVKDISLRSTTLNGRSSQKIVVPNAQLTTQEVKNYTRGDRTKGAIHLDFDQANIEEATSLLREIVEKQEDVLEKPAPEIFFTDTDDEINAEVHYWLDNSSKSKDVKSQVLKEFNQQAVKKGIFDGEKDEKED